MHDRGCRFRNDGRLAANLLSQSIEDESKDKLDISFPGVQKQFIKVASLAAPPRSQLG